MSTMSRSRKPPPALLQNRVLAYAILPRARPFLGVSSLFIGTPGGSFAPISRVPRLAICEDPVRGILLLFCNGDWSIVASTEYPSVAEAKASAERSYPGSSRYWVTAKVSKARAAKYLDRVWAPFRCLFCLKTPLQHDEPLIKKGKGRICGACISEFAADIAGSKLGHKAVQQRDEADEARDD
jgi:hypothetical protein